MVRTRSIKAFIGIQTVYSIGMIVWVTLRYFSSIAPTSLVQLPVIVMWMVVPVEVMTMIMAFMTYRRASSQMWGAWTSRWVIGFFLGLALLWMPQIYVGPLPPPPLPVTRLLGAYFETFMSLVSLAWLFSDRKAYVE